MRRLITHADGETTPPAPGVFVPKMLVDSAAIIGQVQTTQVAHIVGGRMSLVLFERQF